MCALSQMIAKELQETAGSICRNIIYARIDELPEKILDILAYDMHIDWYGYDYPIKIKQRMIKTSIKVHKKMGTRYAVESVLQSLHPKSHIEEWFEYGGSHHCFRIVINADSREYEIDLDKIIKSVNLYKRLTAHLESVNIERRKEKRMFVMHAEGIFVSRRIGINPYNKTEHKICNTEIGSAEAVYVSLTLRRKGGSTWKEQ
ncbi:MAG: phage tail protein I [Lachnospiraceae bacterium]|nr:phage tail protein I [Lachnospiraceae bacterium]